MQYHYEALDDKKFQKLASALIVASHPDAQCLPVGQPDGGRDAFRYLDESKKELVVYQVKYSRDPQSKEERDVISEAVETEKKKVQELISRGLKKYILITNVSGTAHMDVGSIDQQEKLITKELGVPSYIWWRDDIDARLDSNSSVKFSYPEILKLSDFAGVIFEGQKSAKSEQISTTIQQYISHQFSIDREVKFKQVDLTKNLFDLFVDVPIWTKDTKSSRRKRNAIHRWFERALRKIHSGLVIVDDADVVYYEDTYYEGSVAAASFVLDLPLSEKAIKLVIEGAPGQGKSTVTQYLCQVHRHRLLQKPDSGFPDTDHLKSPLRVPFKVDLRDLASWMGGKHPYASPGDNDGTVPAIRSLENFLSMQVNWQSGGLDFSSADLAAFFKGAHILIVLDGFDEVADRKTRSRIIEEVSAAAERISGLVESAQFIVTSRPSAFANSPGFSEEEWAYLELQDLKTDHIKSYSKKWTQARSLSPSESQAVSATLNEKIQQTHLRELARNPMQLAILLALIHMRGPSLPEKRTELYDRYMDLFLSREAEKTTIVKEHRELLFSIHGFLAWMLQSEAEAGKSGAIEAERLKELLHTFLEREGHPHELVDELFTGMVERVVALVSRVAGTYEFEVQPLREFFAGHYLYDTANYGRDWSGKSGTLPDRFSALSKNPYWTNVNRFFCGFYNKGELPSLVNGLKDFGESEQYRLTAQPRSLATMLLSDWVFSHSPRDIGNIVDFLTEKDHFLTFLLSGSHSKRSSFDLKIPPGNGRKELLSRCFELGAQDVPNEVYHILGSIIQANAGLEELISKVSSGEMCDPNEPKYETLMRFGVIRSISASKYHKLFPDDSDGLVKCACFNDNLDFLLSDAGQKFRDRAIILSLEMKLIGNFSINSPKTEWPELLAVQNFASFNIVRGVLHSNSNRPAYEDVFRYDHTSPPNFLGEILSGEIEWLGSQQNNETLFATKYVEHLKQSSKEWCSSTEIWTDLFDCGIALFGDRKALRRFSLVSTMVRSRSIKGNWSDEGWGYSKGLVERLRFARLKSGQPSWWREQLSAELGDHELSLCLSVCLFWCTPKTLRSLNDLILKRIGNIGGNIWNSVAHNFNFLKFSNRKSDNNLHVSDVWNISQARRIELCYFLLERVPNIRGVAQEENYLLDNVNDNYWLYRQLNRVHRLKRANKIEHWKIELQLSEIARKNRFHSGMYREYSVGDLMPVAIAKQVLESPQKYSGGLIAASEARLSHSAAGSAKPVFQVAAEESWFSGE